MSLISALLFFIFILTLPAHVFAYESNAQALSSLQSYTGILNMPTARVKPDWSVRMKLGYADPYAYYGIAVGLFDRFEFHGQFTKINTIQAFPGFDYGNDKDRSAGMRAVLIKENEFFPQVALGFYDALGTGKFSSRYMTASKMFGHIDVTLGLGQGILAGEFTASGLTSGETFLTSDPFRKTKIFGGAEWHINPDLTLCAEYSTIDRANMYGYRDNAGVVKKKDNSSFDLNFGIKYKLTDKINTTLAYLRGNTIAGSIDLEFPLNPEGLLSWKKSKPCIPGEKIKWDAYESDNLKLSAIIAKEIKKQGFKNVSAACGKDSIWIEFTNTVHLSDARSLGQIASICDKILPQRITFFYLNIKHNNAVIESLKTTRGAFDAFRDSKLDKEGFLAFSKLNLYKTENWKDFKQDQSTSELYDLKDNRFSFEINPKITTFLDNKVGFVKQKGFLRADAGYRLWSGAKLSAGLEWTMFNQFDELDYNPLEKDNAVRTDLLQYENQLNLRMSVLALNQNLNLPFSTEGRFSIGYFESAYAGVGAELFRYFHDGLWGAGLETEHVRKRDPNNNFLMSDDPDKWYTTEFLNLYAQVLPSQGIEAGLKIGRFLAGDTGFSVELRRSFKYFTLGAWYTKTHTDIFKSPKNRGTDQKGVYIRIPLSLFFAKDIPGHLEYAFSSFTRDPGALVDQPESLYPMSPWSTPDHTKRTLNDMKKY